MNPSRDDFSNEPQKSQNPLARHLLFFHCRLMGGTFGCLVAHLRSAFVFGVHGGFTFEGFFLFCVFVQASRTASLAAFRYSQLPYVLLRRNRRKVQKIWESQSYLLPVAISIPLLPISTSILFWRLLKIISKTQPSRKY